MSEEIEFHCRRWSHGYQFAFIDTFFWIKHRVRRGEWVKETVEVPLDSMFKAKRRTEPLKVLVSGRPPCLRAMFPNSKTLRTGPKAEVETVEYRILDGSPLHNRTEVQVLEKDLYQRFMRLPNERHVEDEVLTLANRYGLLVDHEHPRDCFAETVAYWQCKAEEMHEATRRRQVNRLEPKHYRRIDSLIGPLQPFSAKNERAGSIRLALQVTTLLGALWLQWERGTRSVIPYQGDCVVCGAPVLGRRSKKTCSDYCRKQLSLENQK